MDFNKFTDCVVLSNEPTSVTSMNNRRNKLYLIESIKSNNAIPLLAYSVTRYNAMDLWHSRLGHLGHLAIINLVKRGRVSVINMSARDVQVKSPCDVCERANLQRASTKHTLT